MIQNFLKKPILLLLLLLSSSVAFAQPRQKVFTGMVESIKDAYNNRTYGTVHVLFTDEMANTLSLRQLSEFMDGLHEGLGDWKSFEQKSLDAESGQATYLARFENGDANMDLLLDNEDRINGLLFKPTGRKSSPSIASNNGMKDPKQAEMRDGAPETEDGNDPVAMDEEMQEPETAQPAKREMPGTGQRNPRGKATPSQVYDGIPTQSSLAWPFDAGVPVMVFWGGQTEQQNYHVTSPEQRFALDLVMTGAAGSTHSGDGTQNKDYYIYGKKVKSATNGVVVSVVNGIADNTPGQMNAYQLTGNNVVVKTDEGEFVMYAHLKPGSVKLKPGKKIRQGKSIGLVGNSGNSSEPHLHFQVMTDAQMQKGKSLLPVFSTVQRTASNKTDVLTNYSPLKGDVITKPR